MCRLPVLSQALSDIEGPEEILRENGGLRSIVFPDRLEEAVIEPVLAVTLERIQDIFVLFLRVLVEGGAEKTG